MDVFGLGQCSLDTLGLIPAWPSPDSKCEFGSLTIQGGGPVATAMVALSRWGLSCHFAGVAGDDPFGGEIARFLREDGVDATGLVRRAGHRSQFAFIAVEPGGRRTIFWQRPTGEALRPGELRMDVLRQARLLHTDGLFIEASLAAASEAKKSGAIVSVDAGTLRDGMLDLARHSDCFVSSEAFARELVGGDDPPGACRKILELGPRIAGVTLGARGYTALFDGRSIRKPACAVDAVDTTGCGDVFHGAYAACLVQGLPAAERIRRASAAACLKAGKRGAQAGAPTLAELEAFLAGA